jgi:hypothetical protein
MAIFNSKKSDILNDYCIKYNKMLIKGDLFKSDYIIQDYNNWEIVIDRIYKEDEDGLPTTRIRAAFIPIEQITFSIYRKNILSIIAKIFYNNDNRRFVFNNNYIVKTNNLKATNDLLNNINILTLINLQPYFIITIKKKHGFMSKFPKDVNVLYFRSYNIDNIKKLRVVVELFMEILSYLNNSGAISSQTIFTSTYLM